MRVFAIFLLWLSLLLPTGRPALADTADSLVQISDAEGLVLAVSLANAGRVEEARRIYELLLQSGQESIRVEAAFKIAQLYLLEQNYSRAAAVLTAILNRYPDLARVRLDLALAYFLDENYDDARFHFELAKGSKSLPEEVRETVDLFLTRIRRQKNWSLHAGFSLIPDSNFNMASGMSEECVNTSFGLLCRSLEGKKSGVGGMFNLGGDYYLKFDKSLGLRNTLGFYATDFSNRDHDDHILYAASGPRFVFEGGEASAQATYMRRWYAGQEYSQSWGVRLDAQKDFDRLILSAGAALVKNHYEDNFTNSALHGEAYSLYLKPRYLLSSRSFVQAGLDYTRDGTRIRQYGSDAWRFSLGGYHFFKYGFSIFTEASLTDYHYHADQYYITRGHGIESIRRKDRLYGITASLATNLLEHKGIRPMLQYGYTRRTSNIWSREYERHRVNLSMEFRF